IEKQEGQKTVAAGAEKADEALDAAASDEGVQAELEARAKADEQKKAEIEARAEADEQKKAELEARAEADRQKKAEVEAEIKRREEAEAKKRAEIEAKVESEAKARAEAETQLKNKDAAAVTASTHDSAAVTTSTHDSATATASTHDSATATASTHGSVAATPATHDSAAATVAKTPAPDAAAHTTAGLSPADFMAICKVVEAEAGHQPVHGRSMVANVILNRVKSPAFPNSVSGVLTAPGQFTVVRSSRYANAVPSASTQEAVRKAVAQDMSGGALYFHRGSGSWGNRSYIGTVGSHGFYR
ncbi:MAG: cell wall hydrolase, partial [Lachnospiraceae bacterium]|nr:cell wall hydrolase [Lachnospiraceae bacterium]